MSSEAAESQPQSSAPSSGPHDTVSASVSSLPMESQPQQHHQDSPSKPTSVTFSIWPPTQSTRDAVTNRLIETLSTPSILCKRYGVVPEEEASALARQIEEDAFTTAAGFPATDADGLEILQVYSKEISKRMLDTVKARPNSASITTENSSAQTPVEESISSLNSTDAVSTIDAES